MIEIGPHAIEVIAPELSTEDVIRRVTLYDIVNKVGVESWPYHAEGLKSDNVNRRYRSADLIGQIAAVDARDSLRELLKKETDHMVLPHALRSLGIIGQPDDVSLIAEFADHEAEATRRNAASALGTIGDVSAISVLLPMLNDELFSVRYPAATALTKIGEPAVSDLISALEKTTDVRLQGLLLEILGSIGDSEGIKIIFEHCESDDVQIKRYAAIALSKIKNAEYLPRIEEISQTSNDPLVKFMLRELKNRLQNTEE